MKTASDFDPEVLKLFDQYVHGGIDRRGFLDRAAKFAVGGMTAAMLLDALNPRFAQAQQVPADDKRLKIERVEYRFAARATARSRATWSGRRSRRASCGRCWWCTRTGGLNPHIEDVTRRIALEGFIALAPDALTPLGGYPGDEDKARELFGKLDQTKTTRGLRGGGGLPEGAEGPRRARSGWSASATAAACPTPWPRGCPTWARRCRSTAARRRSRTCPKIKAPLLIHYAENDERINAGAAAYEEALKAAKVKSTVLQVPGHPARLQQRHHPPLRQGRRRAGLEAHDRLLQEEPGLASRGSLLGQHRPLLLGAGACSPGLGVAGGGELQADALCQSR